MRRFRDHTTARAGGAARGWIVAHTEFEAIQVLSQHPLPPQGTRLFGEDPLLVLGGGSNLLVSDVGFTGTVLQLAFEGITAEPVTTRTHDGASDRGTDAATDGVDSATGGVPDHNGVPDAARESQVDEGRVLVTMAAGHEWDDAVAWTVHRGYAGLEALSGIPGSAGATPVQNVGAYGAEVSQTLVDVRVWDRLHGEVITLTNEQLEFGYRDSLLKRTTLHGSPRYVVLSVRFSLEHRGPRTPSSPVRYAELARSLGLDVSAADVERRAPLTDVRAKVLALRGSKGMVLDPRDPDTWSTGSFFTNPIVGDDVLAGLPDHAPRFPMAGSAEGEARVKLSAAWLIEQSGCGKGFGLPDGPEAGRGSDGRGLAGGRASLSTKHSLAVTNRGEASTEDLLCIARAVQECVRRRFGIEIHPEPVLVACEL